MVTATLVPSELGTKVVEGVERVGIVEPFLILTVATFYLAIVPGCVWTNELMADTQTLRG